MSTEIAFEWDSRDLAFWRGGQTELMLSRAIRSAGDQALREMRKASVTEVTNVKNLKPKDVREGLPLFYPKRRAPLREMVWEEKASGKAIPLSKFPYVASRSGVQVRVNKGSAPRLLKHAFVAKMRSGHVGIWRRLGKSRLPIDELWSTKISDAMNNNGVTYRVLGAAQLKLSAAFKTALDKEMEKLVKKGII